MYQCCTDDYEGSSIIFVCQQVSTFRDTSEKITFLKLFILEISLECV